MQTIKVTSKEHTATDGKTRYTAFIIGNTLIATVGPDLRNKGRYQASCGVLGCCNNACALDAYEFAGSVIEGHFAAFGLNVEFVNA